MQQRLNCWIIALGLGYWVGRHILDGNPPTLVDWAVLVFLSIGSILVLNDRPDQDQDQDQQERPA